MTRLLLPACLHSQSPPPRPVWRDNDPPACYCLPAAASAPDPPQATTTRFGVLMASMDQALPWFPIYKCLPTILVVHCTLCALNLWERLIGMCVKSKHRFSDSDDVDDE